MLHPLFRISIVSICAVWALAGCGGGGGGGGSEPKTAKPAVSVDWPERSRTAAAPSSALSVRFTLDPAEVGQPDLTFVGNRGAQLTSHFSTYTSPTTGRTGLYSLTATFFADSNATGTVVGRGAAEVRLQANGTLTDPEGTPLGTFGFTPVAHAVTLPSDLTFQVGEERQLTAAVTDAEGNPLVRSPGSFVYSVTEGADKLAVTKDGVAEGLQAGTATVTVTVDGRTSAPVTVTVRGEDPTLTLVGFKASDLAVDTVRGKAYALGTASGDPTNTPVLVPIDLTTGAIGASVVANAAGVGWIEVSEDGRYLFLGVAPQTIERFDLTTGEFASPMTDTGHWVIRDLHRVPGHPGAVAATRFEGVVGMTFTTLFNGAGEPRGMAQLGRSVAFRPDGRRVYGYDAQDGGSLLIGNVGADGSMTVTTTVPSVITGESNGVRWSGGQVVSHSGTQLNPDTGAVVRQLLPNTANQLAVDYPTGTQAYFLTPSGGNRLQGYDTATGVRTLDFALGVGGTFTHALSAGPGTIVFATSASQVGIVRNVP